MHSLCEPAETNTHKLRASTQSILRQETLRHANAAAPVSLAHPTLTAYPKPSPTGKTSARS